MSFRVIFTNEFRRRLERLYESLSISLYNDSPRNDLWSCLFSVYSFMWCSGFSRCTKKICKDD